MVPCGGSQITMTAEEVEQARDGEKMLDRKAAQLALEASSDEEEDGDEVEGAAAAAADERTKSVDVVVVTAAGGQPTPVTIVQRGGGEYTAHVSGDPEVQLEVISLHGGSLYVRLESPP